MTPNVCVYDIGDLLGCTYCGETNRAWWVHGEPRCFDHSNLQATNYAYRWFKKSCEPRRWLPQRWTVCQDAQAVDPVWFDMPPTCDSQYQDEVYCYRKFEMPEVSYRFARKNAGTCTPGAGPVCEVGV